MRCILDVPQRQWMKLISLFLVIVGQGLPSSGIIGHVPGGSMRPQGAGLQYWWCHDCLPAPLRGDAPGDGCRQPGHGMCCFCGFGVPALFACWNGVLRFRSDSTAAISDWRRLSASLHLMSCHDSCFHLTGGTLQRLQDACGCHHGPNASGQPAIQRTARVCVGLRTRRSDDGCVLDRS